MVRGSLFLFVHGVLSFVSRASPPLRGFVQLLLKATYMHLSAASASSATNSKALLQQLLYF